MDHSKSSVIILRPSSRARVFTSSFEFEYSGFISFRIMYSLSILYFAFFFFCCVRSSHSEQVNKTENLMKTWADHAYKWFASKNCSQLNCTTENNCLLMKSVEKFNFRIYGTEPIAGQKIGTVFPDGDVKHKVFHDGVIVLDPFPMARFGHPVLVFHANVSNNQTECEAVNGFLVEDQYCLQLFIRSPCVRNHKRGIRIRPGAGIGQNCGEVVFLPMVYLQSEPALQVNDRLQCFSNIEGFNRFCPQLRPEDRSKLVTCHPVVNNEQNCGSFANKIDNKCSTSQTCDHAVLLSGGWNRQLSDVSTWNNIVSVKRLLMTHGFLESNIATFFANGPKYTGRKPDSSDDDEDDDSYVAEFLEPERYFSSSMKDVMRNHIKNLCDNEYCADTLLIYLNSPAKPDGSSLLWDFSDDGVYAEDELYTPKELFRDIYRCRANRVVILADQNYGNGLEAAAEARLGHLENVAIFTAYGEFNANGTKDRLTAQFLREKYFDFCLSDFQNVINNAHKSAEFVGRRTNLLNATLVGGPCFAKATSLNDPSVMKYRGCSSAPLV